MNDIVGRLLDLEPYVSQSPPVHYEQEAAAAMREAAAEIRRLEALVEELKTDRVRISDEAETEDKRLRDALNRTAEQALSSEIAECGDDYWEAILEDSDERASYQRGYDAAIMCARKALEGGE